MLNIARTLAVLAVCAGLISGVLSARASTQKRSGRGIKCTLHELKDAEKTGMVAFTFFVPEGWQAKSSLNWTGQTYFAEYSAMTPDKQYIVDHVEPFNLTFSSSTGSPTRGVHIEHATDFLHALVGAMQQKGLLPQAQTVDEFNTELPLTQSQVMMQKTSVGPTHFFHESGYVKLTFELNGVPESAMLGTTVIGSNSVNNQSIGFGATRRSFNTAFGIYTLGPTMYVVAPTSPSAAKVKEAQIVASSGRMTPDFMLYCAKLANEMAQAGLNATMARGRQQIRDMEIGRERSRENFKNAMAAKDANSREFCNYILDRQDYKTPGGSLVTLPSNYNHAWSDGHGGYVLTDSPTYNPKGAVPGNWEELQKAQHGG